MQSKKCNQVTRGQFLNEINVNESLLMLCYMLIKFLKYMIKLY